MSEFDDAELLRAYAGGKSETAFAELVRRHVDMVYAVALRRVGGDAHLAEDVAQGVFTDLARKAATLARHPALGAWLFRSARFAAAQAMRAEKRRGTREQEAHVMQELIDRSATEPNWNELRPVIDDVMDELPERDRVAVWLRFYEERTFAEVGAKLAASEDAVRVRVDRALEKMRGSLARRGVASTTAVLTSALARESGAVAPAGFAANVTSAALAGAAAGGGGIAAAAGLSTFMSTTKLGAWGVIAALVLGVSLTGNAYLLTHQHEGTAPLVAPREAQSAAAKPAAATLGALAKGDVRLLLERLRADGASEATARGVIEGVLRLRYQEALLARRAELMHHGWWKDSSLWQPGRAENLSHFMDDRTLLRELVLDPLEQLFGADPVELAERDAQFEFLPSEKRKAFIALERDYEAAVARVSGSDRIPALTAGLKREHDDALNALVAALEPAERTEYDLHFSPQATRLRERMSQISASEAEYRSIMAVLSAPENGGGMTSRDPGYADREQRAVDQVVATLGYDRALDYVWAGAWEYPTYARLASEAGLPANTAGRVLQLAAETSVQAGKIHADATLTATQRREALAALQQQVRPQLDALLPPAQQQRLDASMLIWFTLLGEGRYRFIATTAAGNTGSVMAGGTGIPIETPLPAAGGAGQRLIVRRPSGN